MVYVQVPAHPIRSHLQQPAHSEPNQCDQEWGKQSHKLSRIRDLELWERNCCSQVLLHLCTHLLRIFFQCSSRSLAVSFWKAALCLRSPDSRNIVTAEHMEALWNQTTMLPSPWTVNHILKGTRATKLQLWINSGLTERQVVFQCFYKYIWKQMVPMYVAKD